MACGLIGCDASPAHTFHPPSLTSTAPTTAPSKPRRATGLASTTPAPCATAPSLTRPSTAARRLSSRSGLGESGERAFCFGFAFYTPVSNHRLPHPPPAHHPHSQVIKGWDQGLLGACVGEKRKLQIPPELGYGPLGSPPKIPPNAQLIFDTEVMSINGKPPLN